MSVQKKKNTLLSSPDIRDVTISPGLVEMSQPPHGLSVMHHDLVWCSCLTSRSPCRFYFLSFLLRKTQHIVHCCQCDLQPRVWSRSPPRDGMMTMMMMMCWWDELRCCSYTISVWALLKTPEAGRRWDYLRRTFPSHWSLNRSCSDALRWHSQVSGDKKKSDESAQEKLVLEGGTASFHLMVDVLLRVLTRLEVSVQLLRYWLNTFYSIVLLKFSGFSAWRWKKHFTHHYAPRSFYMISQILCFKVLQQRDYLNK